MSTAEIDTRVGGLAVTLLEPEWQSSEPELAETGTLFTDIALDMGSWGEKSESLLSELADLLDTRDGEDRAEDADDLVEDLEEWVDDAEIDADRGRHAIAVLRPLGEDD